MGQTLYDCNAAPLALVSCACMKDQNSGALVSSITNQVGESCGSTATADVSSALAVFANYCSAGKGLTTPKGVTASGKMASNLLIPVGYSVDLFLLVTTTPYASNTNGYTSGPYYSYGPTTTSAGSTPGGTIKPHGSSGGKLPIAAIAGGAGGALVFIIFIAFVGWRYRRRSDKKRPFGDAGFGRENKPDFSKPELANSEVARPPAKNTILRKPAPVVNQAPVSPLEREGRMDAPNRVEVPAGPNAQEMPHDRPQYEVHGSHQHPFELSGARANMNEGPFEMDGRPWS